MAQKKRPPDKTASADQKPSTARKQSRMDEILRVVEEYARGQRELMKALRKNGFFISRDHAGPGVSNTFQRNVGLAFL